jgi:hypothetical protein
MGLPNDQAVIGKPWTEGSTSAPYYQYAIEIDDSPSDDQFDCMYGDSSLTLQVFSFGPVLTSGKTYHVACVWDNTHLSGYIDGQLVSSVPLTSPLQTRSSTLRIGGDYRNPPTQYFNGILDDVRIYNYALSASEIQDLYNQGSSSGSACNSLADSNGDSSISITELINYISQWKSGSVTIGNLIDAIGKWKGGC